MSRIAFIGQGAMGSRMARRLQEAGHELAVYTRSGKYDERLLAFGALPCASPRKAAAGADFVFAMVTDDKASRQVWLHPESGALDAVRHGAVLVECSTLTPAWIRELAEAAQKRGAQLLDAPVSGSRPQAEGGQLAFLVGGDQEAFDAARHLFGAMGHNVRHVGPTGAGSAFKLAVNALLAAQVVAYAEVTNYLGKTGVPATEVAEVFKSLPVSSAVTVRTADAVAGRNFKANFPIALIAKDLRYAVESMRESGAPFTLVETLGNVFQDAAEAGFEGDDMTGVVQFYERGGKA